MKRDLPGIVVLEHKIASDERHRLVERYSGDMVKYVVDLQKIAAVGGKLHADTEQIPVGAREPSGGSLGRPTTSLRPGLSKFSAFHAVPKVKGEIVKSTVVRFRYHILFLAVTLFSTPNASAEGEVTGVIGGLLGGKLEVNADFSTQTSFDNAVLYGVRGGWVKGRFGIEGSFVRSFTGIKAEAFEALLNVETPTTYIEGNVLFIFLKGNVSPFLTGGAGLHRIKFELSNILRTPDIDKLGYNFGGGIKANIDRVTIRFDVRDHLTPLKAHDFGILGPIAEIFGIDLDQKLHNLEVSFGIGVRF